MRRSVAAAHVNTSRMEADLERLKAAAGKDKEAAGAAATRAVAAAASESAARARVAVAIGAREDAEKTISGLRDALRVRDEEVARTREVRCNLDDANGMDMVRGASETGGGVRTVCGLGCCDVRCRKRCGSQGGIWARFGRVR